MGEGVLGLGGIGVCSPLIRFPLGLLESGLGHLLSQYGSQFGGETVPKVLELGVASGGGNGEIRVEEIVDEGVIKSRGDLQRWRRERGGGSSRRRGRRSRLVTFWDLGDGDVGGLIDEDGSGSVGRGHEWRERMETCRRDPCLLSRRG